MHIMHIPVFLQHFELDPFDFLLIRRLAPIVRVIIHQTTSLPVSPFRHFIFLVSLRVEPQ